MYLGIYVSVLTARIQIVVVLLVYIMATYFAFNLLMHHCCQAKSQRLTSCQSILTDEDVSEGPIPSRNHPYFIPCSHTKKLVQTAEDILEPPSMTLIFLLCT